MEDQSIRERILKALGLESLPPAVEMASIGAIVGLSIAISAYSGIMRDTSGSGAQALGPSAAGNGRSGGPARKPAIPARPAAPPKSLFAESTPAAAAAVAAPKAVASTSGLGARPNVNKGGPSDDIPVTPPNSEEKPAGEQPPTLPPSGNAAAGGRAGGASDSRMSASAGPATTPTGSGLALNNAGGAKGDSKSLLAAASTPGRKAVAGGSSGRAAAAAAAARAATSATKPPSNVGSGGAKSDAGSNPDHTSTAIIPGTLRPTTSIRDANPAGAGGGTGGGGGGGGGESGSQGPPATKGDITDQKDALNLITYCLEDRCGKPAMLLAAAVLWERWEAYDASNTHAKAALAAVQNRGGFDADVVAALARIEAALIVDPSKNELAPVRGVLKALENSYMAGECLSLMADQKPVPMNGQLAERCHYTGSEGIVHGRNSAVLFMVVAGEAETNLSRLIASLRARAKAQQADRLAGIAATLDSSLEAAARSASDDPNAVWVPIAAAQAPGIGRWAARGYVQVRNTRDWAHGGAFTKSDERNMLWEHLGTAQKKFERALHSWEYIATEARGMRDALKIVNASGDSVSGIDHTRKAGLYLTILHSRAQGDDKASTAPSDNLCNRM